MLKEEIIKKAGFPIYVDYWDKYFSKLSGDQLKEVFKIIFHFNKTFEILETNDLAIDIVVTTLIDNIKRDAQKRLKQSIANIENGKLGGRPYKQKISKPEANKNVNVNNNLNEESKSKLELKIIKKNFIPPTLEEVKKYCTERNSSVNANKFFDYYNAGSWKDAKGNSVKNWKQKLITWEGKTNNSDISTQSNTNQILCDSVNKMAGHTLVIKIDVSASNKAVLHFNNKDDFDKFTQLDESIRNSVKNNISSELKTVGFEIPKFK